MEQKHKNGTKKRNLLIEIQEKNSFCRSRFRPSTSPIYPYVPIQSLNLKRNLIDQSMTPICTNWQSTKRKNANSMQKDTIYGAKNKKSLERKTIVRENSFNCIKYSYEHYHRLV